MMPKVGCCNDTLIPPCVDGKLLLPFDFKRKSERSDQIAASHSGLVLISLDHRLFRIHRWEAEFPQEIIQNGVKVSGNLTFAFLAFLLRVKSHAALYGLSSRRDEVLPLVVQLHLAKKDFRDVGVRPIDLTHRPFVEERGKSAVKELENPFRSFDAACLVVHGLL
jgi:hypothetical protein